MKYDIREPDKKRVHKYEFNNDDAKNILCEYIKKEYGEVPEGSIDVMAYNLGYSNGVLIIHIEESIASP